MSAPTELVHGIPLFADLNKKELQGVASSMKERTFNEGQTIASEGQSGIGFFVIAEGNARVTQGDQERGTLGPGDYFGEIALIDDGLRTASVKVYTVSAFNRGVADWLSRLPTIWVEGEVTELKRQDRWQTVFFTLKDPSDGACLRVTIGRGRFDALKLGLENGRRVHVFGRPELFEAKGDFSLRALSIEHFGLGDHLAALERLKDKLAAEGLFERKRALPRFARLVGVVTGNDAAAKRDILTAIQMRFPPARVIVAETYVQGPYAAGAVVDAMNELCKAEDLDVIVVARGGGSFEDLLPFSDERLVRAVASCRVPVVSAVGHEQDTPLTDLAADGRASTPSVAARLVVPDADELRERLTQARGRLHRAPLHLVERKRSRVDGAYGRLRALSPRSTLERGYAIVRSGDRIV